MNLAIVNEGSTAYLTLTPRDRNGNAEAPEAVVYTIVDVASGTEIRAETELGGGASVTITLTPTDNRILNPGALTEKRRITITAPYNIDDAVTGQYEYLVRNLHRTK